MRLWKTWRGANLTAAKSSITDDVVNASSGTETSLNQLAETPGRVMGVALAPEYGPACKVNSVSPRLADVNKAERLLGFRTQVSLEEGLRRLVTGWSRACRGANTGTGHHCDCDTVRKRKINLCFLKWNLRNKIELWSRRYAMRFA